MTHFNMKKVALALTLLCAGNSVHAMYNGDGTGHKTFVVYRTRTTKAPRDLTPNYALGMIAAGQLLRKSYKTADIDQNDGLITTSKKTGMNLWNAFWNKMNKKEKLFFLAATAGAAKADRKRYGRRTLLQKASDQYFDSPKPFAAAAGLQALTKMYRSSCDDGKTGWMKRCLTMFSAKNLKKSWAATSKTELGLFAALLVPGTCAAGKYSKEYDRKALREFIGEDSHREFIGEDSNVRITNLEDAVFGEVHRDRSGFFNGIEHKVAFLLRETYLHWRVPFVAPRDPNPDCPYGRYYPFPSASSLWPEQDNDY